MGKRMKNPKDKGGAAAHSEPVGSTPPAWQGRFPYNEIISLLDVNRPFNLAESTSQDLTVGRRAGPGRTRDLRGLKLGYGRSAGSAELREEIAKACQVPAEHVITTQGHGLGALPAGLRAVPTW